MDSTNGINDWTIMFFFASDNELSLLNVSQIKALKDAGYQTNTDLLLYFDSNQRGVPTRLFNVNGERKDNPRRRSQIGDGEDPYVRNFLADQIRPYQMNPDKGPCTTTLYNELSQPDGMHVSDALENFIGYCRENNPAKHYMLVLVGHGMIVANDSFLADDNPRSAITLVQLGDILKKFKGKLNREGGSFELLGLHSCSMSAIEIVYELKDTAKYLIASQGFAYVGSWPYRQLLKKIFNTTENNQNGLTDSDLRQLIKSVYELSLYNATDFAFSGYSHDLTLCSLDGEKIGELVRPLVKLTDNLKWSLKKRRGKELILLAHLQSQSFWREEYTDIYDFCWCLRDYCDPDDPFQKSLLDDCQAVMDVLERKDDPFDGLVIFSDNFGWEYQYARGLSIYFPWSRPLGNEETSPLNNYRRYAFYKDFDEGHSWLGFLIDYWKETERAAGGTTSVEYDRMTNVSPHSAIYESFNKSMLGSYENKPTGGYNKPGAGYADSPCLCPSIKNFPTTVKLGRRIRRLSMTPKVQKAFEIRGDDDDTNTRP